jgi:hypothetical protein
VPSSDPNDHYNDNPSDHGDFDSPERCIECLEWYPCSTTLAAAADNRQRVEWLRFWRRECRCEADWAFLEDADLCPLHEPCDGRCGARREPGDEIAELKRALVHAREHSLWGGCSPRG